MSELPILYSFRRCPYAMRARMALMVSGQAVRLREVVLREKPEQMLEVSPKATVPVLVLDDEAVIDESLAIMRWALSRADPGCWMENQEQSENLIASADDKFKFHLDRYKYPSRYEDVNPIEHRAAGLEILKRWNDRLKATGQLTGERPALADIAIFPFVRQFANVDRVWFDSQPIPALQKWLAGHLESALFHSVMPKFPQWKMGDDEPIFGE